MVEGATSPSSSQLEGMTEVLRIAAHDNNLFRRETFEALAHVLARYVPLDCLAVVTPEPGGKRLYAASLTKGRAALPPFGACFPHGPKEETVLKQGTIKICDDTRNEKTLDQIAVHWGFLSYVIVPIRRRPWTPGHVPVPPPDDDDDDDKSPSAPAPIVGKLVVAFREVGFASRAPLDLLLLVAELFGETFERSVALTRQRRLAMILETSGDAMLAWDATGRITDANLAAATLIGTEQAALIGTRIDELLDLERMRPEAGSNGANGGNGNGVAAHSVRTTLVRRGERGGEPIPVSVTTTAVEDDPLVAMHALLRDESHIVAAEQKAALHFGRVRELEKELRTLLDNAPLIIFRLDPATKELKYLNRHAERLLGVPTAEALRTTGFLRAIHRDGSAAFDSAVEVARAGRVSPPYEARLQWGGDGDREEEIAVRGTIYPLRGGESGSVVAVEGILVDVSAEHAARSRAIQADRLSTLGLLAASVAHEINNPASFILLGLGNLGRLLQGLSIDQADAAPMRDLLSELHDSIKRIVRIVRDLRLVARPPRDGAAGGPLGSSPLLVDVNEVIESALSLARGRIMERAALVTDLANDLPPVAMDSGRLGQVVINLLVNAADAMPKDSEGPSRITVMTRAVSNDESVEIVVSDTGSGIPKHNLHRIWTPFFTTKSIDIGTGLGLSISREIVEGVGGRIAVESPILFESTHGRGSRFVITLPAATANATQSSQVSQGSQSSQSSHRSESSHPQLSQSLSSRPPSQSRSSSGAPTSSSRRSVLIVEDEVPLAQALALTLRSHHDVAVAHEASLALELLAAQRFDAVLCDLRMPQMSGETLYSLVSDRDEAQARAFIFMSGIGFVPEVERFLISSGRPVLQKPFEPAQLLELIAAQTASDAE